MSQLLDQFRRTIDPYALGYSQGEMLGLGLPASDGVEFPYVAGGVILRRRRLYPTIGPWTYCGFARPGETAITSMTGYGHDADMAYEYAAAQVLGNGFAGPFSEPARIDFDGSGNLISERLPNGPGSVAAEAVAGGKFLVAWEYDPYGQGAPPTDFQVFEGVDAASVNYAAPLTDSVTGLATVAMIGRRRRYTFTTAAFGNGTVHVFAVRARNGSAVAEKNTFACKPKTARTTAASVTSLLSAVMRKG